MDRGTAHLVPRKLSYFATTAGSSRRHPGGTAKLAFGRIPTKNLRNDPFAGGTACLHWQHGEPVCKPTKPLSYATPCWDDLKAYSRREYSIFPGRARQLRLPRSLATCWPMPRP